MKKGLTIVIVLLISGFFAYKLIANKQKNAEEVAIVAQKDAQVAVRVAKVSEEMVADNFTANGTFKAEQDLNVSSEIGGLVTSILVKEGDFVKVGQVLAYTKADQTSVQLNNAKAVLETAKSDLARFENAFKTGGVTAQQLEQARLQLTNAQANFNSASITSGNNAIISRVSGIVSSKEIEVGTMVSPGQPLFNVVNISNLKLNITIDENRIGLVKLGDKITIALSGSTDVVEGKVSFIAPKANAAMKFPVEVLVPNTAKNLRAGMYATAQFISGNAAPALVVPHAAFVGSVSQGKIFKIVDGKSELISVKAGRNFGDKVEIIEGLKTGDEVVISGQINLTNQTPVKIVE